jgi:glycosyltransferase involved in cell wall biosynthesis
MPDRPRVLHLGPDPQIGGGMAAALAALLSSPLAERYELENVATYRGPEPLSRLAVYCLSLLRLATWSLRGRGRIVHVHATVRGSMYRKSVCVLVAKALRRKVVFHIHSGAAEVSSYAASRGRLSMILFRAAFGAADAVLAVSAASGAAVERAYRIDDVAVVPNAAPSVTPFTREVATDGTVRVAYLGGFANPAKGVDVLLQALRLCLSREPRLRVALAGPGDPASADAELIEAEPALEWIGWLGSEEKDELLRAAAVFVMPSRSEGLPMALLEAMAYRMAVIATAVGGIPEVVETEVDGLLVEPDDPEALADGLCRLVADDALRSRLATAAHGRAERLDATEVAGRLGALYASLD